MARNFRHSIPSRRKKCNVSSTASVELSRYHDRIGGWKAAIVAGEEHELCREAVTCELIGLAAETLVADLGTGGAGG
jgi:hypothetical protein